MIDNFKIRQAQKADWNTITNLISDCYQEVDAKLDLHGYDNDLSNIDEKVFAHDGEFVVIELNEEIIGTQCVLPSVDNEDTVLFKRLYVHKQHRGSKAAKMLMEWALNWAEEKGFKQVEFFSDTNARRAHNFFEKFGFVQGELIPPNSKVPYEQFRFCKTIHL